MRTLNITNKSCSDRLSMILVPCLYLNQPDIAYNDCCLLQHENKNGLTLYIPPLIEVGGTYTNLSKPINVCWIFIRMAMSIYFVFVLLFSAFIYYTYYELHFIFIYFTHWVVFCCCMYIITSLACSIRIYKKYEFPYLFHADSLNGSKNFLFICNQQDIVTNIIVIIIIDYL
eukprot:UN02016